MTTFDAMSQLPGFCYCQQPSCGAGQIHDDQHEQPIITCIGCGNKTCFTHQTQWHEGRTCTQYDAELKAASMEHAQANQASDAAIASMTKPCPRCHRPIEKNGGCQHMTCMLSSRRACSNVRKANVALGIMCKQEFCWDCSALWEGIQKWGNTAHDSCCPWHSNNLPTGTEEVGEQYAVGQQYAMNPWVQRENMNAYLWF
jgi:IBR domain, a half RING-finger domain